MAGFVNLKGGGNGVAAKVTNRGQLVVSPIDYSSPYTASATVINTAYKVVDPISGKRFVITDIIIDADKNVSASTAGTIVLYEAEAEDTTTAAKTIITLEMLKNTNRSFIGLNLLVSEGKWVNIKTTDNNVYVTILGYYVEA